MERGNQTWDAAHHPFTSPHEDDITSGRLVNDKGAVRALAYDIVLNGTELGSGSIRIHRKDVQQEIFRSLGMSDEEAHEPASASSSTPSSTAPRPTAASPSASTASS